MVKSMRVVHRKTKQVVDVQLKEKGYYYNITREDELGSFYGEEGYWNEDEVTPLIEQITSLDVYQKLAARTLPDLTEFYGNDTIDIDELEGLDCNDIHALFGVTTEFGEIEDLYKKSFAYRKIFDKVNLLEEVCDIMWYIAASTTINGQKLSYEMQTIIFTGSNIPTGTFPSLINMKNVYTGIKMYKNCELNIEYLIGSFVSSKEEFFKGLTNNINKLIVRYPEKFNSIDAINRSLDVERKELEQ